MQLSLYHHLTGLSLGEGNHAVYALDESAAYFGPCAVSGRALRWELEALAHPEATLSATVNLDPGINWLLRCDRVDFPPGGVAYRHTHPGPGIRCLVLGSLTIDSDGAVVQYTASTPNAAWFESGPEPVLATASPTEPSAFVRVMLLPREWEGQRTIRYVDPSDAALPKRQQAHVYFDVPIEL